ncbi:MAG: hypothetical protein ACJ74U_18700 [Jatrophihabitantaceae bacterium]
MKITRRDQFRALIRFQLGQLGSKNQHHLFEDICRAFASVRITPNVIPASGPVGSGGDQGRDFENLLSSSSWRVSAGNKVWAFACTLQQQKTIATKIQSDLQEIMSSGPRPDFITYFSESTVPVGLRHRLIDAAKNDHGVLLQILDGNGLADLLTHRDCQWIAHEYLDLPIPTYIQPEETFTGIAIREIDDVDPIRYLGVHRHVDADKRSELPAYVPRSVDGTIDTVLDNEGFVILEGSSASGKSRSAYEALRRLAARRGIRQVLVPQDGHSLRRYIAQSAVISPEPVAIWLDDLERYVGTDGLDVDVASAILQRMNSPILATIRSQARMRLLMDAKTASPRQDCARQVLQMAETVRIDRELKATELADARRSTDDRIKTISSDVGKILLGERLCGGPAVLDRWLEARDGNGQDELAAAAVSAAVDFRRAGFQSPIPGEWVRTVLLEYIDPRLHARYKKFSWHEVKDWCTELVYGASSCLVELGDDSFEPFDYLVDYVQRQSAGDSDIKLGFFIDDIPGEIWHTIGDNISVEDPSFLPCLTMASVSNHPGLYEGFLGARKRGGLSDVVLFDSERILALARACRHARMCVPCMALSIGLDLDMLVTSLVSPLDEVLDDAAGDVELSHKEIDCIAIIGDICDEGLLQEDGTPIPVALTLKATLGPRGAALISLMDHLGMRDAADSLRQLADS